MLLYETLGLTSAASLRVIRKEVTASRSRLLRSKSVGYEERLYQMNDIEKILLNKDMRRVYDLFGDKAIDFLLYNPSAEVICMAVTKINIGLLIVYLFALLTQIVIMPLINKVGLLAAFCPLLIASIVAMLGIAIILRLYPEDIVAKYLPGDMFLVIKEVLSIHVLLALVILLFSINIGVGIIHIMGLAIIIEILTFFGTKRNFQAMFSRRKFIISTVVFRALKIAVLFAIISPIHLCLKLTLLALIGKLIYNVRNRRNDRYIPFGLGVVFYSLYIEFAHLASMGLFIVSFIILLILPFIGICWEGYNFIKDLTAEFSEPKRLAELV
jgi:hypothetical protein